MSKAYNAFIEIVNQHLTRNPTASPCWDTVLSDIRTRFPTFNRSIKTLQRWYNKYRKQVNPDAQALRSGRKINSQLKENITEHIQNHGNKARSYSSTASTFHIPVSTARLYIKQHIGFVRKMKQTIPYRLSDYQKKLRVYYSIIMMKILEVCREVNYKNVITGDESYFVYDYDPNWIYLPPETPPPPRVKSQLHSNKLMLTIFLWGGGLCLLSDIPKHSTMTASVFINKILTPISEWWRKQQSIRAEDLDQMKDNTDRAILAAATAVGSIIQKDLTGMISEKTTPYQKLEFIKTFQSQVIQRITISPSSPPLATPPTPTLPVVPKQKQIPPPTQMISTQPPSESHHYQTITNFQRRKLIASALNPLMSAPLASTSISQFLPQTSPSFPVYCIHRSLRYPTNLSNAASLLQLLFGSEMFRHIISSLNLDEDIPLFVQDVHDLFIQLSTHQVSSVDLVGYQTLLSLFLNDDTRTALNHNIELLRSYFWSNLKLVDIENVSLPLRTTLSSSTQRYIEQSFEIVSLPSHPPTGFLIYLDRLLPSGDKLNTTFYFPIYDQLIISQYGNVSYHLLGLITHTNQNDFTAIVRDPYDERWIQYFNGRNITLTDRSWPYKLAYGDDYDDGCSSACVLFYERQESSLFLSELHDTYTPFKSRMQLHLHNHTKQHDRNPLATPILDHPRRYVHVRMESDTDSLSSSSLSSTSTSSTLFDEDDSDSISLAISSSSSEERIISDPPYSVPVSTTSRLSSSSSSSSIPSTEIAVHTPIPTDTAILTDSLTPPHTSTPPHTPTLTHTPALTHTSTPPHTLTPPQTSTFPHSSTVSSPLSSIPPPPYTSSQFSSSIPPSSLTSTPAHPQIQISPPHPPPPADPELSGTGERSVFVDNSGAMHIAGSPSYHNQPLELFLHVDNARVHTAVKATEFLETLPFIKFPHPPYSPDIAPCDFFLFGYLKRKLAMDGIHASDITNVVRKYLVEIDSEVYLHVFDHWHDRLKWVASHNGEYYPANSRKQLVAEYKHLYHLRSNTSLKDAADKPYLCQLCNRRYSSKPSLQTHKSLKHSFRQSRNRLCLESEGILRKEANRFVKSSPINCRLGTRLVEHFSCVPMALDSHAKDNLHQLSLRIWNPDSQETLALSGTLILQQFVKSHLNAPVPTKILIRKDLPHSCTLCSRRFSTDAELLIHSAKSHPEKLRNGSNLLGCTLCSAEFSTIKGLLTHIGMQHRNGHDRSQLDQSPRMPCQGQQIPVEVSEKPVIVHSDDSTREVWLCPYCDRKFATKASTKMHTSKIHKEKGQSAVELLNSFLNDIISARQNIKQMEGVVTETWRRLCRLTDDNTCDICLLQNKTVYVLCKLYYCSD